MPSQLKSILAQFWVPDMRQKKKRISGSKQSAVVIWYSHLCSYFKAYFPLKIPFKTRKRKKKVSTYIGTHFTTEICKQNEDLSVLTKYSNPHTVQVTFKCPTERGGQLV